MCLDMKIKSHRREKVAQGLRAEPGSRPDSQFFCLRNIILTAAEEGCLTKDKQHPEVSQGRIFQRVWMCTEYCHGPVRMELSKCRDALISLHTSI